MDGDEDASNAHSVLASQTGMRSLTLRADVTVQLAPRSLFAILEPSGLDVGVHRSIITMLPLRTSDLQSPPSARQ